MAITKSRLGFLFGSALLHAGLAAVIIAGGTHSSYEPTEVVLFEVKGDHKDPVVTRLQAPAAKRTEKKIVKAAPAAEPDALKTAVREKAAEPVANPEGVADVSHPGEGAGQFGTANGAEVSAEARYTAELRAMLERRKEYPILARRLRQQGRVIVKFTLERSGQVVKAEVIENSAFDSLNRAAEKLITSIDGLRPFPAEVKKAEWVFVLPVEYRM